MNVKKIGNYISILLIASLWVAIGNSLSGKHTIIAGFIGCCAIAVVAIVGYLVHLLPLFNRFPLVFWVSLVGVIISIPGMPGQDIILNYAKEVDFLPLTTPVLAYAGLSLGKDLPAFKRLSWRIVPVALAVSTGTFIMAVIVAQVSLYLEGAI